MSEIKTSAFPYSQEQDISTLVDARKAFAQFSLVSTPVLGKGLYKERFVQSLLALAG
ncbi:hypothetical protein [Allopseudospirillum japonicum]|uniref:hypothetical protein n=1 Tax=Allopseudospirillum japonicum TaxID=64971 RepID=UPI0015A5772D|nr:hypothetical protein [Allopseudospirillum japonicum]